MPFLALDQPNGIATTDAAGLQHRCVDSDANRIVLARCASALDQIAVEHVPDRSGSAPSQPPHQARQTIDHIAERDSDHLVCPSRHPGCSRRRQMRSTGLLALARWSNHCLSGVSVERPSSRAKGRLGTNRPVSTAAQRPKKRNRRLILLTAFVRLAPASKTPDQDSSAIYHAAPAVHPLNAPVASLVYAHPSNFRPE